MSWEMVGRGDRLSKTSSVGGVEVARHATVIRKPSKQTDRLHYYLWSSPQSLATSRGTMERSVS